MPFQVDFTRKANRDVEAQLAWWVRHGRSEAERWHARFMTRVIETLEADPHVFPEAEESGDLGINLRVMLHGRRRQVYRVLFTVEENRVIVHRVRHAAQDRLTEGDL
jgi:plasmid stabilization system protein ParE